MIFSGENYLTVAAQSKNGADIRLRRLSKNSPNRQSTTFFKKESFCDLKFFFRFLIGIGLKLLMILHFDFLREPHSAVPLYADECGSLGFVAFSTVYSVSKSTLSTR